MSRVWAEAPHSFPRVSEASGWTRSITHGAERRRLEANCGGKTSYVKERGRERCRKGKTGLLAKERRIQCFISSAASELHVHLTQPLTSRAVHFNTFILLSHHRRANVQLGFMSDVISGIIDV